MQIVFIVIAILMVGFGFTAFTGAPYVPSLKADLERDFLRIYKFDKKDFLIDLGSGDGKVLKIVADTGATAYGIELNPLLVWWTRWRYRHEKRIKVKCQNFFGAEFPEQTTVVYVFGDSRDFEKIYRKVENEARRLGKILYLISYGFERTGVKIEKNLGAYHLYKIDGWKQ